MEIINLSELVVPADRQRREHSQVSINELADSIARQGLLHPLVIRKDGEQWTLVAGERRLKAIKHLWATGGTVRVGGTMFRDGHLPCTYIGDLDPIDAFEVELEENIRRVDLTWQEQAAATSQLYELRRLQAERRGDPPPAMPRIAEEVQRGEDTIRAEILVARHLDDPEIAKAKTAPEALKILKRREERKRNEELGERVGRTFTAEDHILVHGEAIEFMRGLPNNRFDCILTDPPYGINAQDFNDAGGKARGAHPYDDSYDRWRTLIYDFAPEAYRVARDEAHLYCFCDIDNFVELRGILGDSGWTTFRTPIVWYNPQGNRVPWPEHGPQRRWQICLYAMKGKKNVIQLKPDVIICPLDEHLGHPAQKPIDIYVDLLRRSTRPGDSVLDPFCGTGTIFPAAHGLKLTATGVEIDQAAYGIATKRLQELK